MKYTDETVHDLLEACEAALIELRSLPKTMLDDLMICSTLRKAIAKARGEAEEEL